MSIFEAIDKNDIDRVKELLPIIDINTIHGKYTWTPLLYACARYKIEIIKLLLTHPNIDVTFSYGHIKSPFKFVMERDSIEIIKLFISHKSFNIKKYLIFHNTAFTTFPSYLNPTECIHNLLIGIDTIDNITLSIYSSNISK